MENTVQYRAQKLTAKLDMLKQPEINAKKTISLNENINSYMMRVNQKIKQLQENIHQLQCVTSNSMKKSLLFQQQVECIVSRYKIRMEKLLENYRNQFQDLKPSLKKQIRKMELIESSNSSDLQIAREESLKLCQKRVQKKIKQLKKKQKQLEKQRSSHCKIVSQKLYKNIKQTQEQIEQRNKKVYSFQQKLHQMALNLDQNLANKLKSIKLQNTNKDIKIKQAFQKCMELI